MMRVASRFARQSPAARPRGGRQPQITQVWGSAETAADACYAVVAPAPKCDRCDKRAVAPIGRPLTDNVVVRIDGGELVVAGAARAMGYADGDGRGVFANDEVRTGDIGERCEACGALVCRGRRDDVVNVAGVSVDLKELEARFALEDAAVAHDLAERRWCLIGPGMLHRPF